MTLTKIERLKTLYKKYLLNKEDIFILKFGEKETPIITRTGIDKIQSTENIKIQYETIEYSPGISAAVKATATWNDKYIETYGEASKANTKMAYPLAMAEKRAMSRIVLKLTGFYELGVYGEEENDDFQKNKSNNNQGEKPWKNV